MSGAAKVNFNVTNVTQTISKPLQGIQFVQGRSVRGPFASPDEVINSWPQFVAKYGGLTSLSEAPHICKRMLEKGCSIRFSRVGHYGIITDKATLDAVKANQPTVTLITFDESFVTGNVIDMSINGVDLLTINYNLTSDNTMDLIAEAIATHPGVKSASVIENSDISKDNNQIFITPKDPANFTVSAITITGGTVQPVDTISQVTGILDSNGIELFQLLPKYEGADYNNFMVTVTGGSNGQPGYFNIHLKHKVEPSIKEDYVNLRIIGNPDATNSTYLEKVISQSKYLNVVYKDLSSTSGQVSVTPISFQFSGGSDGTSPTDVDYVGDSAARNGFFAFDPYSDSYELTSLDNTSSIVQLAGASYSKNRQDLVYYSFLDSLDLQALVNKRAILGDNKYQYIFGGNLSINDPITNQVKDINPVGDIFALIAASDKNYGEWYSFAGPTRGTIDGVLGVNPNFGAPASWKDLDDLANRQINMVINRHNSIKLWGNFTGQYANDQERFVSILRFIMFLKKSLKPTLETFLEEPNDIPTWKRIHFTVKPFLDSLVVKRAMYSYKWQGDQDATSLSKLQVNDPTEVGEGKYKVNLLIKATPSIQEINVNIILAPTGIEFEIVSELI